ncbi:unnamed protein product [Echinostoma caproni]|uniref:Uncharacterized protein n=1 Tax=Echinostoma caproni TaxID=27848 RepID=A0A183AIB3_9TREM|nr:unnamed protein product [Echinostoma caproni]
MDRPKAEIGRLFRWFDSNLFMEFLAMHLVQPPTLMSYGCLKMLRASLEEFIQYDRRFLSMDERNLSDSLTQITVDMQRKLGNNSDCIPDSHFLNCAQIRALFNAERSALWLHNCQQYLTDDTTPTFICLPAFDCVLKCLTLAHQLPQFSQAVQCTESTQQQNASPMGSVGSFSLFGDKGNTCNLAVDPTALFSAVQAAINYIHRFEVVLDDRKQPVTTTGDHLRLGCLRPYSPRRTKNTAGSTGRYPPLATFLIHIVTNTEPVLFYYLPPIPNVARPDPATRYAAGQLLSPMLLSVVTVVTWPLALLPPSATESLTVYPDKYEPRVLAVRRLLRLIAAIVHALPLANEQLSVGKSTDPNSFLSLVDRARWDLTGTVNSYFAQLEKVLHQLHDACSPIKLCQSTSWWWFRAMCEHLPRMMQIAPHANPVGLIRLLLDEATHANERRSSVIKKPDPRTRPVNRRARFRWKRAIDYARGIAAARIASRPSSNTFAYRWPTVSALLRAKSVSESSSQPDLNPRETTKSESSNRTRLSSYSQMLDEEDSLLDATVDNDQKQSAFDQMTDDEPDLLIEPADPDTSSSEEQLIEFERESRKHRASCCKFSVD